MAEIKLCSIEECGNPIKGKGFCNMHMLRMKRHGNPLGGGSFRSKRGEGMSWIHSNLEFDGDECLIWPFARSDSGYGVTWENGKIKSVHVKMCELKNGKMPSRRMVAAHSCGKGHDGCVNPNHLRWATYQENIDDKKIHGTYKNGETNPGAKLTNEQAEEIRSLIGKYKQKDIGEMYGISQSCVSLIKLGKHYNLNRGRRAS